LSKIPKSKATPPVDAPWLFNARGGAGSGFGFKIPWGLPFLSLKDCYLFLVLALGC